MSPEVTKPLVATGDPNYHGDVWYSGLIYVGCVVSNFFVVNRTGFGPTVFSHVLDFDGTLFYINVDTAGRVVDVSSA